MRRYFSSQARQRSPRRGAFIRVERLEDRTVPTLFTQAASPLTNAANNGCIAAGDLDGDGYTDFVVTNYGNTKSSSTGADAGKTIGVLFGSATGLSTVAVTYPTGHADDYVSFVAIADMNGDNKLDIVAVASQSESNKSAGWVTVFLNSGIGTFPAAKATQFDSQGRNATWVGIADFNGDNVPDIAVTHMGDDTNTGNVLNIFQQNVSGGKGNGTYFLHVSKTISSSIEFLPIAGTILDVDGQNGLDIVVVMPSAPPDDTSPQNPGKLATFINDGTGVISAASTFPSTGGLMPLSVASGDVNGDGIKDLVIANAGDPDNANGYLNFGKGTNIGILLGDGAGGFGNAKTLSSGLRSAFAVTLADLDLDGDLDIAVADIGYPGFLGIINPLPGALVVYRNNGSGAFSNDPNSPYTDTEDGHQYLAVGDLDNKGNPDIVAVGLHNRVVRFTNSTRPTVTALEADKTTANTGEPVTFTATVQITGGYANNPSGTVSFLNGTVVIGTGTLALSGSDYKASFTTSSLPMGSHNITARYEGLYTSSPNIGKSKSTPVTVTINNVPNTPPTISDITDKTVSAGATSGPHGFTIGDAETPANLLTLSAKSSNTSVIPTGNITFGGSGANRTVSIQAPVGVSGSSTITITVTDAGGLTASDTFVVTVTTNTPPTISEINDVKVTAGTTVGPISFSVGDNETGAASLVVTGSSNNPALIENSDIVIGGSGKNRTVTVTTYAGLQGNTTITITATDPGGLQAFETFVITQTIGPVINSITSTSPNGTYSTGQSINITINFSEPVTLAGGNLLVTLDTGAVVSITPFSNSATASGTYVVQAGHTSPDLNVTGLALSSGATLVNSGNAAASLALPASNLAQNANIIVNPPPPTTVSSVIVNSGAVQRSRLTTITLNFSNPINAADYQSLGAIRLTRTAGGTFGTLVQTGATGANGRILVAPLTGTVSALTLTFDNANGAAITQGVENGSLADGRWQITIPAIGYSSTLNDPNIRRLFGDGDGNGTVDGADFSLFGSSFAQNIDPFDFDANGTVDGIDFAQFGSRFGVSI